MVGWAPTRDSRLAFVVIPKLIKRKALFPFSLTVHFTLLLFKSECIFFPCLIKFCIYILILRVHVQMRFTL